MQETIQSWREESVDALLRSMKKTQKKTQLCATHEALHSLVIKGFRLGTSPMLYAAQCGNNGTLSALLRATLGVLKPQVGISCLGSCYLTVIRLKYSGHTTLSNSACNNVLMYVFRNVFMVNETLPTESCISLSSLYPLPTNLDSFAIHVCNS